LLDSNRANVNIRTEARVAGIVTQGDRLLHGFSYGTSLIVITLGICHVPLDQPVLVASGDRIPGLSSLLPIGRGLSSEWLRQLVPIENHGFSHVIVACAKSDSVPTGRRYEMMGFCQRGLSAM